MWIRYPTLHVHTKHTHTHTQTRTRGTSTILCSYKDSLLGVFIVLYYDTLTTRGLFAVFNFVHIVHICAIYYSYVLFACSLLSLLCRIYHNPANSTVSSIIAHTLTGWMYVHSHGAPCRTVAFTQRTTAIAATTTTISVQFHFGVRLIHIVSENSPRAQKKKKVIYFQVQ